MSTHLIDDCWLCILVRLPLCDLILRTQLVSHRWKFLTSHASALKRGIKLRYNRDTYNSVPHEQYDDVYFTRGKYFKRFQFEVMVLGDLTTNNNHIRLDLIMRTFPDITSLEFRQINPQAVHRLVHLLDSWPKLVTLKLFVGNYLDRETIERYSGTTSEEWNFWLKAISDKLKSLRNLVFYERAEYVYARIRLPVNFCPQLESLHVGLLFEEANVALSQIVKLKNLRAFGFIPFHLRNNDTYKKVENQYKRVLLTKFTSSLKELMLRRNFDCHTREWKIQCTFYHNYQNLTHLSVHLSKPLHWFMLDSGLHNLANLTYLSVQNWFFDNTYAHARYHRGRWSPQPEPNPCYASLRTLHLAHVPCFKLDWTVVVLPNLETLQMDANIRILTPSTHSSGHNTFVSLCVILMLKKGLHKLRQVIYRRQVFHTQPVFTLFYRSDLDREI